MTLPIEIAMQALNDIAALRSSTAQYPSRLDKAIEIAEVAIVDVWKWVDPGGPPPTVESRTSRVIGR